MGLYRNDKEFELLVLNRGISIAYAPQAHIYDEKVNNAAVFVNQRRRWISAQLKYFVFEAPTAMGKFIRNHNIDYLDKVFQLALPPRIIALGITFGAAFIHYLLYLAGITGITPAYAWSSTAVILALALVLAVPRSLWNIRLLRSLLAVPIGFGLMLKSFFRIRGANGSFIHTPHGGDSSESKRSAHE